MGKEVNDLIESRVFEIVAARSEAEGESMSVEGYAAKFGKQSEDLGFIEIIETGAFDDVLGDDVRCLFNHDPNYILARTKSGTLNLSVDNVGLKYKFEIPNTTIGRDFKEMLSRGDVSQSSFSFTVKEESWDSVDTDNGKAYTRHIVKVKQLFDVAPVTYPAYPDTTVALRSIGQKNEVVIEDEVDDTGAILDYINASQDFLKIG